MNINFDSLYKQLNRRQKEAVDAIDGPVMVIAGPGTGKTQILTLRIANILKKTDTAPENILALTFTESGVYSMRRRLTEIIGAGAYKVRINTFHGFCNDVIKQYPEEFPRIIGSTNASEIDQIRILEKIFDGTSLEKLRPYGEPYYYVRPVLGKIRELKRENISFKEFQKTTEKQSKEFTKIPDLYYEKGAYKGRMKGAYKDQEKNLEKNTELGLLYQKYEETLRKEKLYDYEDMILEVITTLKKNGDLLLRLQEEHQYILADEHQDANNAQNRVLELLSSFHASPNLFIVGDEKQAIFRFQGASLENFLYFRKLYPKALLISLEENYRSTQTILDASHSLISKNRVDDSKLRVKLKSSLLDVRHPVSDMRIVISEWSTAELEIAALVKDIQKKIKEGVAPESVAVLFRDNRDAFPIIDALERTDIPFALFSEQNILADSAIKNFLLFLRLIDDPTNRELLSEVLFLDFLNIPNLDVYKILRYAFSKKILLYDLLSGEEGLKEAGVKNPLIVAGLFQKILGWSKLSRNTTLVGSFEIIVRESGFLDHLLKNQKSLEGLHKLDVAFQEVKKVAEAHKSAKLNDFISHLNILESYKVPIRAVERSSRGGVRLMTAHRSKGQEFDYIYIVGVYDTHWGNKRDIQHFRSAGNLGSQSIEDERRLFYVALTRAKKEVSTSYAREGLNGAPQLPSQFLEEIDKEFVEILDTKKLEESLKKETVKFAPKINVGIDIKDKKYLHDIFLEQGLSVTALNNYLHCPWEFFFNNLIRLPIGETKHQLYGTAIHETLKSLFDAYKNERDMTKKNLLELFEHNLRRKPLMDGDFSDSLKKGKNALEGYYDFYKKSWNRNLITEFRIGGVFVPLNDSENLLLKGTLDKLELEEGNNVNVVDYKTAKPRSRNDIMGETKSSEGNYYRQLVFYKLLLDRYKEGGSRYVMSSGEIDFIEPNQNNKYQKERFVIKDEEVKELEELLKKVGNEILNVSYWNEKCDEKDCEFCRLRDLIVS